MEKKNNKLTIFLIIVIAALTGYIVYDKTFSKENEEEKTEIKEEIQNEEETVQEEKETVVLLNNDEAIKIGKELYLKAKDLYICQLQKITGNYSEWFENSTQYSITNGVPSVIASNSENYGFGYIKLKTDVSSKAKGIFTSEGLKNFLNQENTDNKGWVAQDNSGNLYCKDYLSRSGYKELDEIGILVSKNEENEITFTVTDYMSTVMDSSNVVSANNTFKIKKENDTWKIESYIDSYSELSKKL